MRFIAVWTLLFPAALLGLGCGDSSAPAKPANPKVAAAQEKMGDAVTATVDAAKEKRDEYVAGMQKRLDEMAAKYEDLKVLAGKAQGQAKKDLEKKFEDAKAKRDEVAKGLADLKTASVERWEKVKDGVEKAYRDMSKSFD